MGPVEEGVHGVRQNYVKAAFVLTLIVIFCGLLFGRHAAYVLLGLYFLVLLLAGAPRVTKLLEGL